MKKKLFHLGLILCLILVLTLSVAAQEDPYSGSCGEHAIWNLDPETGTLTISGTGEMYDYGTFDYDCAPWFTVPGYNIHVLDVIVEEGITYIGNNALVTHIWGTEVYMRGDITISSSVASLGEGAIVEDGFAAYETIRFLGSVPQMKSNSIYGEVLHICYPANEESWLEARTMDYGSSYIFWIAEDHSNGSYSGYDNTGNHWSLDSDGHLQLEGTSPDATIAGANWVFPWSDLKEKIKSVTLSEEMSSIVNQCFADCVNLETIHIPEGIKYIFDKALQNCSSLKELVLPDSVEEIHNNAFDGCSSLTEVVLPQSLRMLTNGVFQNCINLKQISFKGNPPQIAEPINGYPGSFEGLNITAYYPADNAAWNAEAMLDYGGTILWKAYTGDTPPAYEPPPESPFADVVSSTYYFDPVLWAVSRNITTGTSGTTFSPDDPCTRGQVVTFLWRAAGCPEPETSENHFTDVAQSDYFYKAVLWAVENGITNGMSDTSFAPAAPCTRAQVATFLWRAAGEPEAESQSHSFTDIEKDYYYDAVLWAVDYGITNGTSDTTFSPANTCTRAQIVTFLYRFLA